MFNLHNILEIVLIVFNSVVILGMIYFGWFLLGKKTVDQKKATFNNQSACRKIFQEQNWRNLTDYFWSDVLRFWWGILILLSLFAFGIIMDSNWSYLLSILSFILLLGFIYFVVHSYNNFPAKAKIALEEHENVIKAGFEKESGFEGDNIQRFSHGDEKIETKSIPHYFFTDVSKVSFPPYEKRGGKQPILKTRTMECLILSREYFSICKGATPFNLFEPIRGGAQCKLVRLSGECNEYYYSQMRNVAYTNGAIQIIFGHDEESVNFTCKKGDAGAVMKALKEKLRITERQRLRKIEEHERYEEILDRRERQQPTQNTDETKEDDE